MSDFTGMSKNQLWQEYRITTQANDCPICGKKTDHIVLGYHRSMVGWVDGRPQSVCVTLECLECGEHFDVQEIEVAVCGGGVLSGC